MYLLIIFSPLISFLYISLLGSKISKGLFMSIAIMLIGFLFVNLLPNNLVFMNILPWINISSININFIFIFDSINKKMLFLVYLVSTLVHIYSFSYMTGDPHLNRFISYLSLFTFFMIILITGYDLVVIFIGWEGVGLCSYLLISYWNTRILANSSAFKAMFYNKIGDVFYLFGIVILLFTVGFSSLNVNNFYLDCALIFFIAMMAKSAQLGLHFWLPDAMEGPTPVSALIHAATMVTAGVYLIIRLSTLFNDSFFANSVIIIGCLTALSGAAMGLYQNDLKKIIAYSTCSQLGYMFLICGFGLFDLGLFHLFNHGFFKALLFLSAGSIIHSNFIGEQDLRRIGMKKLNISVIFFLLGNVAITGIPYFTGYYSKDLILEIINQNSIYSYAYIIAIFSALLTSYYSFKIFFNFFRPPQSNFINIFDNKIIISLVILSILSICGGYIFDFSFFSSILVSNSTKFLPIIVLFLGIWYLISEKKFLYYLTINLFYLEKLVSKIYLFLFNLYNLYFILDNFILEIIGPQSLIRIKHLNNYLKIYFVIYFLVFSLVFLLI